MNEVFIHARNAARAASFVLTLFSSELMSPLYRPDYSPPSLPKLSMNKIIILPPSPQLSMVKIFYVSCIPLFNLLTSKRRKMLLFCCFDLLYFLDSIFITVCKTYMVTLAATVLSCNLLYSSKF